MGFHGFRSGRASFGSVAPLFYPTGSVAFSGGSTLVALAASVALIAGDTSTAAVTASVGSISGGSSLSARAASVAPLTGAATLTANSAVSLGAIAGATSIAGRSASVGDIDGDASLGAPLVRTATITGTATLPAYSASIAPISGASTLAGSASISLVTIAGAGTFPALSASVAPITGDASFAVSYGSIGTVTGTTAFSVLRASVATATGDAGLVAIPYDAPATAGSLALAWTASTDLFNVSRYTNYPFNSQAVVDGYLVGLTSVGAYIMTGDDDAGTAIDASITTDFTDAVDGKQGLQSTPQLRSPRSFYMVYNTGPLTVDLIVSNSRGVARESYQYELPEAGEDIATWREALGRGLRFRYSQVTIANVGGSDFTLQDPQMMVDLSTRRI